MSVVGRMTTPVVEVVPQPGADSSPRESVWADLYRDVPSIEHEDALLSVEEGFAKAVAFLRGVMPTEPALTNAWWT